MRPDLFLALLTFCFIASVAPGDPGMSEARSLAPSRRRP
jgi:hypothetical protein